MDDIGHFDAFLEPHVEFIRGARAFPRSVMFNCLELQQCVSITQREFQPAVLLAYATPQDSELLVRVRGFFDDRGILPSEDYSAQDDSIRVLAYPVSPDITELVALLHDFIVDVYRVSHSDFIEVQRQEHVDAV